MPECRGKQGHHRWHLCVSQSLACDPLEVQDSFQLTRCCTSGGWTGIGGYVAVDHARREIVLSIRGSNNIRNFVTDIIFAFQNCDLVDKCRVHSGFAASWDEIANDATRAMKTARDANPDYKFIVTGHSLGGAVATLAAAYLRRSGFVADAYTFGAPRVGNDHFANFMTSLPGGQWRVTHRDDPVPRLPPIFLGYRHVSPEHWLANGQPSQTDYPIRDIEVCPGIANTACNAGTFGFNIISHLFYLINTAACAPFPLNWKRDEQDISNQELEQRLNEWSQKDQDFVKNWKRDEQDVSNQELEQRLNEWSQKDQEFVANMKA